MGSCAHTCESRTVTIHGELMCGGGGNIRIHVYLQLPYTVHHTWCTHVWWWGQYMHTCVPTVTVHGVPYTVNSCVVVGAIYAYMCTYSYCTRCNVHGAPYTVYSRVVVGAIYAYMCTYSYRTQYTVHGVPYTVNSHVEGAFTCAGDIHVWELLTCETSHQSEILHSLIFMIFCQHGVLTSNAPVANSNGRFIHLQKYLNIL